MNAWLPPEAWRAPALPRARALVLPMLAIAASTAVAQFGWSPADARTPGTFGAWLVLDVLAYETPLIGVHLLRVWGVGEPDCRWPLAARWAALWGTFLSLSMAGCAARGWLAQWLLGIPFGWLSMYGTAPGVLLVMCGFEYHAACRRAVNDQQREIDVKRAQLFLSQAAVARARERSVDEVLAVTLGQVRPALEEASERLTVLAREALEGRMPPDNELAAISTRLRHLSDEQLRQLSHLLHPSVIKLGLLPALRRLASHHEERFGVDIHASRAILEADRLLDGEFSLSERLGIYRIVEAALDGLARSAEPAGVVVRLHLLGPGVLGLDLEGAELGLHAEGAQLGLGGSGLAWALFDSRLQLAGGRWEVGPAPEGGTRLSASLPFGAHAALQAVPEASAPAFMPFLNSGGA